MIHWSKPNLVGTVLGATFYPDLPGMPWYSVTWDNMTTVHGITGKGLLHSDRQPTAKFEVR